MSFVSFLHNLENYWSLNFACAVGSKQRIHTLTRIIQTIKELCKILE
jgi:hypothetical protein